jgi:hypothetical protein
MVNRSCASGTPSRVRVARKSTFAFNTAYVTRTISKSLIWPDVVQLSAPPCSLMQMEISRLLASRPDFEGVRANAAARRLCRIWSAIAPMTAIHWTKRCDKMASR